MNRYIGGEGSSETTVTGWKCNKCGRFYQGESDRTANYCCSTDSKCEDCQSLTGASYRVRCRGCQSLKDFESWEKKELVEWDGETPLYDDNHDEYCFDEESVYEHLHEYPDARFLICNPQSGRSIDLNDHLCDQLPEDGEANPPKEVDQALEVLNKWLDETTFSWCPGKKRVIILPMK